MELCRSVLLRDGVELWLVFREMDVGLRRGLELLRG